MRRLIICLLFLAVVALAAGCDIGNAFAPTRVAGTPTPPPTVTLFTLATETRAAPTLEPAPTSIPIASATKPVETPATEPTIAPDVSATTTSQTEDVTSTPETGEPPSTEGTAVATRSTGRPFTVTPRPTRTARPQATQGEATASPEDVTPSETPTPKPTMEEAPADGWREVARVPPGKHRIALTFDAGSTGDAMPAILSALRERNIHITMFITGKYAEQYAEGVKQAAADGNEIANHTYSHLDSRTIPDSQLEDELARTDAILQNLTGRTSKPYWRPPFGGRNNHVLNVAVAQGYRSIYWTLDSLDSVGQPKTPDFIFNRIIHPPNNINLDGAIVLQHFGSQASAAALPRELDALQAMGLQVVTVSELISP